MIPHPQTQSKFETLRTASFHVSVDPRWASRLREMLADAEQAADEDWLPPGAAWTEVKRSTVRTIYSGQLMDPDGTSLDVHLKLFRAVRLSDRARNAVRGSRSARECHNLLEAHRRGLPAVRPIAAGSVAGSWGSRSFLLTVTARGAPLARGALSPSDAAACGTLLRQAHDAGLHARDLHAGNILRAADGTLTLLDLTSAACGDPLTDAERARALAFFCLDLDGLIRDPAARPLVAAYGMTTVVRDLAERAGRRLRNRATSAFGRRAFRDCSTTSIERRPRRPRLALHRPSEALWPDARRGFADLDATTPTKSGRRGSVYLLPGIVIKERTAAATRRLFQGAYHLQFAGVPTATPVAATTFQKRGAMAARRLPNVDLHAELAAAPTEPPWVGAAAARFGEAVARLHSFGLRNRDLKFENLIRDPTTDAIHMVDLDGIRRRIPGDNRGRSADLGRLLAAFRHAGAPGGDATLSRFLRAYLRTCHRLRCPVPHRPHVLAQAETTAGAWAAAHAD